MKREDLFDAIGHVDENLLDENVIPDEPAVWRWIPRITAVAACIAVVLGTAAWTNRYRIPPEDLPVQATDGSARMAASETAAPDATEFTQVTETDTDSEEIYTANTQTDGMVSTEWTETVEITSSSNESSVEFDSPLWKQAYKQCIITLWDDEITQKEADPKKEADEGYSYDLLNITSGNIPELVVSNGQTKTMSLYVFEDDTLYTLLNEVPIGFYRYVEGENTIICENSTVERAIYSVWWISQETHQLEYSYMFEIEFSALDAEGANDGSTDGETVFPRYYLEHVEISKEDAEPYLNLVYADHPTIIGMVDDVGIMGKLR